MTSLIVWIGIDNRKPSSIYIASDSRITWNGASPWDYGRKVFACQKSPDILGYCGDVLFPSQVLSRVVNLADAGLLFGPLDRPRERQKKIFAVIHKSFEGYPKEGIAGNTFTIVHCSREGENMNASFFASTIQWSESAGWEEELLAIPSVSGVVKSLASGAPFVNRWLSYWNNTPQGGTSRSVFSAFCDAINSGGDPCSGGAPQLVGLYGKGPARSFGIIYKNAAYVFGLPVEPSDQLSLLEWRNKLFERCRWDTMLPDPSAQRHSKPSGLGNS